MEHIISMEILLLIPLLTKSPRLNYPHLQFISVIMWDYLSIYDFCEYFKKIFLHFYQNYNQKELLLLQ